jgi:chromosome segregation ATPase
MSAADVAPWIAGVGASIAAFVAGYFQAKQAKIASTAPQTTAIVDGFKALLASTQAEISRLQIEQELIREKMEICEAAREEGRSERQQLVATIEDILAENANLRGVVEELGTQINEMHAWNKGHSEGTMRTRSTDPPKGTPQ